MKKIANNAKETEIIKFNISSSKSFKKSKIKNSYLQGYKEILLSAIAFIIVDNEL
jgi:hypothetical protein